MNRFLTVATILTAFAGSALAEEVKVDPKTHPWAKFGVGSWVKLKSQSVTNLPNNMKSETTSEQTYTIVEINENEVIVELETVTTMINAGQEMKLPAQKTKMPHALKYTKPEGKDHPVPDAPKTETGTEDLEIAGKKLNCTWTKMVIEAGGSKITSKSWACTDVPGWTVKTESVSDAAMSSNTTIELVGFETK